MKNKKVSLTRQKNKRLKKQVDSLLETVDIMRTNLEEQAADTRFVIHMYKLFVHYVAENITHESAEELREGFHEWRKNLSDEEQFAITGFDEEDEEDETDSDEIQIKNVAEPEETQKLWSMDEILNELNTPKKDD